MSSSPQTDLMIHGKNNKHYYKHTSRPRLVCLRSTMSLDILFTASRYFRSSLIMQNKRHRLQLYVKIHIQGDEYTAYFHTNGT